MWDSFLLRANIGMQFAVASATDIAISVYFADNFPWKKKLKRQQLNKTEIVAQKASLLLRLLHT